MNAIRDIGIRELDHRTSDGIEVTLLWDPRTRRVLVAVHDGRSGDSFEVEVDPPARVLHAFPDPWAYDNRDGAPRRSEPEVTPAGPEPREGRP